MLDDEYSMIAVHLSYRASSGCCQSVVSHPQDPGPIIPRVLIYSLFPSNRGRPGSWTGSPSHTQGTAYSFERCRRICRDLPRGIDGMAPPEGPSQPLKNCPSVRTAASPSPVRQATVGHCWPFGTDAAAWVPMPSPVRGGVQ